MNIGIPNLFGPQAQQGVVRSAAANTQAKAPAPAGESLEVQTGLVAALRETALQETQVRPDMVEKGSAFLSDPNYPPLDKLNCIGSIFVDDFFLKKLDSNPD